MGITRPGTWALTLAALGLGAGAVPAAAQDYLFLRAGNATYTDDEFCEDPTAALTLYSVGLSTPLFGVSVEYNTGDWPWPPPPPPPGGSQTLFLTHGNSFQVMGEINPAHFVVPGLSRYARPFLGAGLHISTDGDSRPGTGQTGPAWGIGGQTRPFIAYGVNGFLPFGSTGLGLTAGYRGTTIFFGDFEFQTPGGATETAGGETLTAGSWTVGLTLQLGIR